MKNRVNELTAKPVEALQRKPSYDPVAMFERLSELVDAAEQQGDIKNAIAGQMFIIECFGYKDSPTLTHEAIRGIPSEKGKREEEVRIRFDKSIAELKKRTGLN